MNQAQETPTPLVQIDDLDAFVKIIAAWHDRKVKTLEHMLSMPEGMEMQVGEEPSFVLTGDTLKGMKAGVQLALMEMGTLPFTVTSIEDPATPELPFAEGSTQEPTPGG